MRSTWLCLLAALPQLAAAAAVTGDGADCARLLQPDQRVKVTASDTDDAHAALLIDDGRLVPLAVTDTAPPAGRVPLTLVRGAGAGPVLTGAWPGASCAVREWAPAVVRDDGIDAAQRALLIAAAVDTETLDEAGRRAGALQARAERRQRAAQVFGAAPDADAPLLRELQWRALAAAIEAGEVKDPVPSGRARWQALRERHGAHAQPTVEALLDLAGALESLDLQRDVIALLEPERAGVRAALGASHRQVLRMERAWLRARLTLRVDTAIADAAALLATMREALDPDDPLLYEGRLLLARSHIRFGAYAASIPELEALAAQLGPERSLRAASLQDRLGSAYTPVGRLSEGLLAHQRSYLFAREIAGPQHPDTLRSVNNYADNLRQLGDNEGALPFAREASEGYNRLYGAGHIASVISARSLSLILGELGRPLESLKIVEPQIDAAVERLGPKHPQTLNTQIHLVELLDLVGRHADAVRVGEALIAPATEVFGETGELTIVARSLLAAALASAGDAGAAREQLAIVLERIRTIGDRRRAMVLLGTAAQASERLGDPAMLEDALRQFVDLADQAERLGLSEDAASLLQVTYAGPYLRYVTLRASRGEVDAAFDLSERFKGRVLLATLGAVAGDTSPTLPAAVRHELAALRARVRAADAAWSAAQGDAERVEAGARREVEAQAYLARRAAARRAYPRFAAVAEAPVLGSADVARVLAPDTCLLSFVLGDEHAGVFVGARGQRVAFGALPAPKVLDAAVRQLRDAWSAAPRAAGAAAPLRELSDVLVPALAHCPSSATRLTVSPDGALALLPFDLLAPGGRALGERFAIGYVQSFSVYGLLRQRPVAARHPRELLAVGAPRFDAAPMPALAASPGEDALRSAALDGAIAALAVDDTAARRAFDTLGKRWSPLPGAAREVRAVGRLFAHPRLLLGEQASEDQLAALNSSGELKGYRYLLVSTHGYLSYTHPSLSAIVLRQPGANGFDGYLTAGELPLYELSSELIVLSACETGIGPVRAGAGVMGLPLALMIAGNRNAVVTLWSVPDQSAAQFVTRLFTHLKAGEAPDRALMKTKQEMARDPRFGNPVHWAGFVLYGAPGTIAR
ncbi:MAG TPA: CHAT domain-containing tetratricopeptide repeat protein [Caldimonas sp.]|nr:CHAT domain-containing tetratricopeptide repeat protein [Caldimonas sp.]